MARWHNIRLRGDLYEMLFHRATQDRRSVAQMADVLLTQALQAKPEIDLSEKIKMLEPSKPPSVWGRGREVIPSTRTPEPSEGQTTVDEMLASCPQCAGELQAVHDLRIDGETVRCMDCGWIREPA